VSQRTIAVIVLALVFGMLAAFAVYQVAMRPVKPPSVEEEEVYVAKENLEPGTMIDIALLEKKKFAKDRLPLHAVKEESQLKDRTVKIGILQGDPIDDRRLGDKNTRGLTPMFEPGERAFTCAVVDSASAGSGFILPQSMVDVLVTLKSGRGDDAETKESVTNMLLQRVQVLAVGTTISPPKESKMDDKASKLRTVTLRVKADQALLLQHAASMGVLHLVLRHPKDDSVEMIKPVGDRMVRLPGSDPLEVAKGGTDPGDRLNLEKALEVKVANIEKNLIKRFDEEFARRKQGGSGTDGDEIKATPVRIMKGTLTDWVGISFEKPAPANPAPSNTPK
jgi:Flp pilus assembly protein CpaB